MGGAAGGRKLCRDSSVAGGQAGGGGGGPAAAVGQAPHLRWGQSKRHVQVWGILREKNLGKFLFYF